ncbi:MAG TPA: hypothetical protein VGC42_06685 [Kofleriaceae bacterium]
MKLLALIAGSAGCVIPPSLEIGADAATNSPPAILSVTSDQQALAEPGPVLFNQGPTAGTLSVQVIDTDATDTLYVRIFVDYNAPDRLNARVFCAPLLPSAAVRTTTCNLTTLCTVSDLNAVHNMTIVVFDREPKEDGTDPAFQAMAPPGLSTSRFYLLKCVPGPS